MGKSNITISVDNNLKEQLKEKGNQSNLINNLLKEYFMNGNHLEEDKVKEELAKLNIINEENSKKQENLNKRLKEIQTKDKILKETFKDIPNEIIKDLQHFPDMTEEVLFKRYQHIYSTTHEITWEELLKAFKQIKGGAK